MRNKADGEKRTNRILRKITDLSHWRLAAGVLLVIALALGAYAAYKSTQPVVLEFGMFGGSNWGVASADSYVIIDQAIEKFEKEHKNVKIHYYSGILKEDYSEWLTQKILKGDTPDVFMVLNNDFEKFSSSGILSDLEQFMKKDEAFHPEDFFTTSLKAGEWNSRQYALPYETVPNLMLLNKTLMTEEGFGIPENDWTWDDLYRVCERITKDTNGDGRIDKFGIYNYSWKDAVYSNGGRIFDDQGSSCYFNSEEAIEAVKFTKKLNDLNQGARATQEDFDNGNVAFMPLSFAEYRTYKTYPYKIKKYTNFQWDCITLPSGPHGDNSSAVDSLLMGISNNSKHQKLAWEFLKLLTYDEEIQMKLFQYSHGVSVLKEVASSSTAEEILGEEEGTESIIDSTLLRSVVEEGIVMPKFSKYEDAIALAEGEILKIYEEDTNVESSLKLTQRIIDKYLKQ